MWRWLRIATLPLLIVPLGFAHAGGAREADRQSDGPKIPPVLYSSLLDSAPVFVTAEAAIDARGELNTALLDPRAQSVLGNLTSDPWLTRREKDCIEVEEHWVERVNPTDRSSLRKAARTADLVLEAVVLSKDYGFTVAGLPGQLLEVRVEEVLRGPAELDSYFIFMPVGTFRAGPYTFCKSDSRFPAPPSPGDRVLLLIPSVPNPAEPFLDLRDEHSLVVIKGSGEVDLPRSFALAADRPLTRAELMTEIREFRYRGKVRLDQGMTQSVDVFLVTE